MPPLIRRFAANGKLISSFASNCPSVGDVNLLIIPVKIPGSDFFMDDEKREIVKQDIELAFFGEESDRLGNPSVKSFLLHSFLLPRQHYIYRESNIVLLVILSQVVKNHHL